MTGNVPYLTGGILFGLILEGIRPKSKARRVDWGGKTDGLSEPDIMKSLIDIFAGGTQPTPYETSFKKNVSDYKKCVISSATYIPFEDQSNINSFKDSIEQNKIDTLESMSMFINEKLSDKKLKWLVSALVETICQDNSISTSERFSISLDKTVSKEELWTLRKIVIEPFLLDVMRYIFVNKIDNKLGQATFKEWYSQSGERTKWKFINEELGNSMSELEIQRYANNEEQTEEVEESKLFEEDYSDIEAESNVDMKTEKAIKQQVLGNPKVIEQHASEIYNIEHANNVNAFINYTEGRKVLSSVEFYNLFVISDENYSNDYFDLRNERFFEYTNEVIRLKYFNLELDDINEILTLPTLFLPEYSERNNEIRIGFVGRLEEISRNQGVKKSRFYYRKELEIDMKDIESNKSKFRLGDWELCRTHWAIKRANLKQVIEEITNGNKTE